jgi:hypothetical protein
VYTLRQTMKNAFKTLILTSLLIGGLFIAPKALADCQPIYGGGQSCTSFSFTVQKLVQIPGKGGGNYVNSLSINDPKYSPAQVANFEIKVTNTSSQTIPTITIKDVFPQFLSFTSGTGNFDTNTKTLTFTINNLGAGETRAYFVSGKIADANTLPVDQGIVCLVNQANGTDDNGTVNASSSQFCVQKTVLAATYPVITPATGPEMLPLLGLFPAGLAGLLLRKKSTTISKGGSK